MRYIDADALGIGKAKREVFETPEYADGWNCAIDVIDNAPTADVVEVVRCEDCTDFCDCPRKLKVLRGFDWKGKRLYKNVIVNSCEYGRRKAERRNDGTVD